MKLEGLFSKPVNRSIEGVIKADDDESLRLEVEEYVITNEIEKRLESFLDAYKNYDGANGVWISGFFGSGKSHLLKMMALLLEDRQIDGVSTLELFLPKCVNNGILSGDLKKAVNIPSKSILFNIDQKADVISKTQIDALLSVFVKVFDEMCGYYGKQGHIAQFERDLDNRGLYDSFQKEYHAVSGRTWQVGREQALLESQNIAKAYAKVTGNDEAASTGILDKYRNQYRVSIEDFAEQVRDYLDRQSSVFRLNFFVDEVGQYIAENVKLMTNLQTIAESLATKCRGRAWIIVTAQEDMSTVVGEMGKQQSNDFTKIQARFANRMKLTSANVAEVIQKRLLTKTDEGAQLLGKIYNEQYNNFKTLFDFADGSKTFRNFRDSEHFISCYPFIPYQFDLFQSSIQNLSQHSAFEGKHSSVGERSMLGVFQQVAIHISNTAAGQLATFDLMFEGIRTALKSNIQRAIQQAEKHLDNQFAIKLLKTLFLVKYVKEFKPTVRNLCVLMQDSFDRDLPQLRRDVEEALNLLEQQTYIQRNGELYEYLTDEEKDVEQEIKGTDVESSDVMAELEKLIFDYVIKNRKIRYDGNNQDYPYTRKMDDRSYGREYELAIHVITPFNENADKVNVLQSQSLGRDELTVLIPQDDRLVREILMYKRTEKYISQNISIVQQETVKRILTDKSHQNRERYAGLQKLLKDLLGKATLFVAGADIDLATVEAQTRITTGFHELITRAYPNLRMLHGKNFTEKDILSYLKLSQDSLFGNDASVMTEAEREMLSFIQNNDLEDVRTTLKNLVERFERKPYGWYYAGILCVFAKLCARGKVDVREDSNILESSELERAITNTHAHGNLVLKPQIEYTASQIRKLKTLYEDFFDNPPRASDAKALSKETEAALRELLQQLNTLADKTNRFPFLNAVQPIVKKLNGFVNKNYDWYLIDFVRMEEELLALKEETIDPLRKFMAGQQKEIYESARNFIDAQDANLPYVDAPEAKEIITTINDPECYKGNRIQKIKQQLDALTGKLNTATEAEAAKAKQTIATLKERLRNMDEFAMLTEEQQARLTNPFDRVVQDIQNQKLIAVIRDSVRRFEDMDYQRYLSQMIAWSQINTTPAAESGEQPKTASPSVNEGQDDYISNKSITIDFNKAWLASEADLEQYLAALRKAWLNEIRKGKRIHI